ncbi:MAG: HNH endonuclease signature motif containing protein, partial [Gemmatimonadaceae bacterium]
MPTKVVVRIDWAALVRGWPTGGEVCEICGVGSVPVSVVRAMAGSGDAFLAAVVTRGVDVVNVAHLGRRPSAFQKTALQWLQPMCSVEGCNSLAHLEVDHRRDWAQTHVTDLAHLDRLCPAHHHRKTHQGWALV